MNSCRVLVLGGYGFFGRRLVERLERQPGLELVVAGRTGRGAKAVALDAWADDFPQRLAALAPDVLVNAAGPFQGQDYRVARACIAARAHYIDLADAREFVAGVGVLDRAARAAGVRVLSGASSVPALSGAVVDHLVAGLARVDSIDIGISPGNRTERGMATVQAILSYCGHPMPGSGPHPAYGWRGTRRHRYPDPIESRLLSPCDVPDLTLLPGRYPGAPRVSFGAGLELPFLHRGMNAMALLTRLGIVRDWSIHARWLKRAADAFRHWGSDAGAMHVTVIGERAGGEPVTRTWHLLALNGDGPSVPTLAASALVRQLREGRDPPAGAGPCIGQLTLAEFEREAQGLAIRMAEDLS